MLSSRIARAMAFASIRVRNKPAIRVSETTSENIRSVVLNAAIDLTKLIGGSVSIYRAVTRATQSGLVEFTAGGERLRVTVQLIHAESEFHIIAEKYDRDLTDLFELQDEIVTTIAAAIEPELLKFERRLPPATPREESEDKS